MDSWQAQLGAENVLRGLRRLHPARVALFEEGGEPFLRLGRGADVREAVRGLAKNVIRPQSLGWDLAHRVPDDFLRQLVAMAGALGSGLAMGPSAALSDAGLTEVGVSELDTPYHAATVEEWWQRTSALAGPLAQKLAALPEADARALHARARAAISAYQTPTGLEIPGVCLIALAARG